MNRKQRRGTASKASTNFGKVSPLPKSTADTSVLFDAAFRHFQSGELSKAEELSRVVCAADPYHAGATHVLGLVAHQRGRLDESIALMRRAIALNPRSAF